MPRRGSFAVPRALVLIFALILWTSQSAILASEKLVRTKEPVFLEPLRGQALVYLVRSARVPVMAYDVCLDDTAIGYLPQRSYLAAHVEPGKRLLWGPPTTAPRWFQFEEGNTYLFKLMETDGALEFEQGDAASIRSLVSEKDLAYVSPTDTGLSELRDRVAAKAPKTPRTPEQAAGLAHTFASVMYSPQDKRPFQKLPRGTLEVTADKIVFVSENEGFSIPNSGIRSVEIRALRPVRGAPPQTGSVQQWVVVTSDAPDCPNAVALGCGAYTGKGECDIVQISLWIQTAVQAHTIAMPEEQVGSPLE